MAFRSRLIHFLLLLFFLGLTFTLSKAQEKQIVRLNEHFYPIAENDSVNYFYKGIIVNLTDSTSIERIFNLKNQIVKVTRYGFNQEGNFPEENTEIYDSEGKISSKKIKNRKNGFYQAVYFGKDEQLGAVLFQGDKNYEIRKAGSEEVVIGEKNVFDPEPEMEKEVWTEILINNLKYPPRARQNGVEGTVILAMYVNEFGEHEGFQVANPENVNESLAQEALRVASMYEGKISPGTNIEGNSVDAWLYIPIRFKLD